MLSEGEWGASIRTFQSRCLFTIAVEFLKPPMINALVDARENDGLLDAQGAQTMRELVSYFLAAVQLLPRIDLTLEASNVFREPSELAEKGLFYSELFLNETPVRPGTPIKVLELTPDGKFLKVLVLDSRDEIQNEESLKSNSGYHDFIGYISAKAPIGRVLPEKELGHTNEFDMVEFY